MNPYWRPPHHRRPRFVRAEAPASDWFGILAALAILFAYGYGLHLWTSRTHNGVSREYMDHLLKQRIALQQKAINAAAAQREEDRTKVNTQTTNKQLQQEDVGSTGTEWRSTGVPEGEGGELSGHPSTASQALIGTTPTTDYPTTHHPDSSTRNFNDSTPSEFTSDMASSSPSLGSTSTQDMADQKTEGGGDETATVASESSMKTTEGGESGVVSSSTATNNEDDKIESTSDKLTFREATATETDTPTSVEISSAQTRTTNEIGESDTSTVITPSQLDPTSTSTQPATRVTRTAGAYYLNQIIGPFTVETDRPQTVDGSLPIEAATATLLRASVVRSCTLYFRLANETVIVRDGETDKKAKQHDADTIQGVNKVWANCA